MENKVNQIPPAKTRWYLENPEKFDINKLEANEMKQSDGSFFAKIPQIGDRIRRTRNKTSGEVKIELVTGRNTDSETGEIREETVVIGTDVGGLLPGMMLATDVYHKYFSMAGELIRDPMKKKPESETKEQKKEGSADNKPVFPMEKKVPPAQERLRKRIAEELQKKNLLVRLGDRNLVRLPEIPGRIRILKPNSKGIQYVQYIYKQWYDQKEQQSRNRKAVIGQISEEYEKAIIPNVNYEAYFNIETGRPWKKNQEKGGKWFEDFHRNVAESRRKQEEEKLRKEEDERLKELYGENSEAQQEIAHMRLMKIVEKIRKKEEDEDMENEEVLDGVEEDPGNEEDFLTEEDVSGVNGTNRDNEEKEEDIETLYRQVSKEREREAILSKILEAVTSSISNRAKKRPDDIINGYKVNKINELLIEIRVKYQGSGYEDLLELIQPPEEVEENGMKYVTGMTYSDVEVLLNHYATVLKHIRVNNKP